jgi:hypothetical protein
MVKFTGLICMKAVGIIMEMLKKDILEGIMI